MTRLIVFVGFIVAFAAGLMVGINRQPAAPQAPGEKRPDRGSWLADQLQLTPEQQERMSEIWEGARRGGHQQGDRRRELRDARDKAIADLVRPEDRAAYEQALRDYEKGAEALEAEWKSAFQQSVERTRAILTPEQRDKYETIMARREAEGLRGRGRPPARAPGPQR